MISKRAEDIIFNRLTAKRQEGMRGTTTIGEIREFLSKYPDDPPVLAIWEGVYARIRPEKISTDDPFDDCEKNSSKKILIIDVESSF